jgi:hypothetical protein
MDIMACTNDNEAGTHDLLAPLGEIKIKMCW